MLRKALSINFNILKVVVDLKVKAVGAELSLLLYCNCAVAEGVSVSESFTVHKWYYTLTWSTISITALDTKPYDVRIQTVATVDFP